MDSHGTAWGLMAGSQPGQQPSTGALYRCNYWQDNAVGASGAGWEWIRAQAKLRDTSTQLEMPPQEIPGSPLGLTSKNIPSYIKGGAYTHQSRGTHTETLRGTHECLMWQKAGRETALPSGVAQCRRFEGEAGLYT